MLGDTILFANFKEQGKGPPKGSNKYSGKNNVTKHKWQREAATVLAFQLTIFLFLSAICSSDSISTSLLMGVFSSISSIKSGSWKMEMTALSIYSSIYKLDTLNNVF